MHRQLNNTDQPASVASLAGSTASQASVEIKGVCKSYGEEWEQQDVIKDLTLDILPGKLTVVVGPSGCGKSI
jgi:ABC-type Fe3+/spermidine/putrescine transport system ATPase subunit